MVRLDKGLRGFAHYQYINALKG